MTRKLITLTLFDDLYKAEKLFKENHIRHIPIVKGDHIIGMLSCSGIERIGFLDSFDSDETKVDNAIYSMLNISQLMVRNPIVINSSATIKSVVEILAKNEIHALPVVENKILVGIVTTTDVLNYLLEQYELEMS
ncbi:HPP family protein [uncultured Lutibacter sp.]|uniref:CBS domain-containing protein n=1 Tax=uncultured Lutibacter sp. TaxID=437739 RepID=UPI00345D7819